MDKMLSVHQNKRTNKQPKTKKKPVKVVYISNPMKVNASASQFRALVQELTGQDADMPDPAKFSGAGSVGGGSHQDEEEEEEEEDDDQLKVLKVPPREEILPGERSLHTPFGVDGDDQNEDVFTVPPTMMMESNFPGFVASNLWYESTHFDDLKGLDIM